MLIAPVCRPRCDSTVALVTVRTIRLGLYTLGVGLVRAGDGNGLRGLLCRMGWIMVLEIVSEVSIFRNIELGVCRNIQIR